MMLVVPVMFIELADAQIAATPEYLLKEGTVSELFMITTAQSTWCSTLVLQLRELYCDLLVIVLH